MTSATSEDPYASAYPPNCTIDPSIKELIVHYYQQVDTQGNHAAYSQCWVEDGVLVVPSGAEIRGRDAIRNLHEGMWDGVPKRRHRPTKIFPFGNNADELVVIGTVEYWPEVGAYKKQDLAAHAKYQMSSTTGKAELVKLQVWLAG